VGIWVLQATAMPSVLIETGYITNREEEDYLNSKKGQEELAECITRAVKTYITWLEQQQQGVEITGNDMNTRVAQTEAFLENLDKMEKEKKGLLTSPR